MAFVAKASGEIFSNRVFSIATMGGQPAMVPIAQLHFSIITVNSVPLCYICPTPFPLLINPRGYDQLNLTVTDLAASGPKFGIG